MKLHPKGQMAPSSNSTATMPATDDEIREKYLERAIRELNSLAHDIYECDTCPRGNLMPVLGSGHPQADIFMLKHATMPSEVEEGVAFYGRAGGALMKSFKRLSIDPLSVYGTVSVKCPVDPGQASPECMARVLDEIMIVKPRIVVAVGPEALADLNDLDMPTAKLLEPKLGDIQKWTAHIKVLYVPDLDNSLDDDAAKRELSRSGTYNTLM